MTKLVRPRKAAALAVHYRTIGATATAERIEADLAREQRCRRCGTILTDPESIARGIGPDCATKADER